MNIPELFNQLRDSPPMVTDLGWLLSNSIGRAAINVINPTEQAKLQSWIDELDNYVSANGKFPQFEVAYLPFSPPPLFWDYKCRKCRGYYTEIISPMSLDAVTGYCKWVDGNISPSGWCSCWLAPDDYKAFTWPAELMAGDW